MSILRIASYYANFETKNDLFVNKSSVKLKNDAGQLLSSQPEWEEQKLFRDYPVTFRGGLAIILQCTISILACSLGFHAITLVLRKFLK